MSAFNDYEKKRKELSAQLQTLKEFEKTDELVSKVFEISRQLLQHGTTTNLDWLLKRGNELAQYAGILDGKSNETWGEYKVAEVAYKSVRDALMLAGTSEYGTVTQSKAVASRATVEAEVDAIAREQRSRN